MFYNYLKTAVRSLLRHRFFSAINIFGLAVAMSICMTVMMLVADQMSYDRHNVNADRIYNITTLSVDEKGNPVNDNKMNLACTLPLGPELVANYAGVEQVTRMRRGFGNHWLEFEGQDINVPITGYFADANALEFFQYELQYGDAATALKDPYTVVLSRKAASKLFKDENPVGQTFKVGDKGLYTVTGVLKETNNKSHIVFDGLASMATVKSLEDDGKLPKISDDWTNYWESWTYVMVEEGKTASEIQASLDQIYQKQITPLNSSVHKMRFGMLPLLKITPGEMFNNAIGPQLPWLFVYFLGGLAFVILLTSGFNFTNLSIARSLTRAREIGVRKVSGAARWQIFTQFISESIVVAFVSLIVAIVLLIVMKPIILQLNFAKAFHWDLYNGFAVYAIFIVFALVVGIMAGFFPAVVLSGFQPITVLKNFGNMKLFSRMGLRKVLVVSQFTLSLFFILSVVVMYNQLNLFTHQDHGFNTKTNIMVRLNKTSYENLKTELKKYNNITEVSAASHLPDAGISNGMGIKRKIEDAEHVDAGLFTVDEDYLANMQLKLKAGNFFKPEHGASNKNFVVLNEVAVKKLNFKTNIEAIGEPIIFAGDSTSKTIIGVVGDYNHRDLTRAISPLMLLYDPTTFNVMQVAYVGTFADASRSIEKAWATVNPGLKIDYTEVESEINKFYEIIFGDLVKVLGFISFLAILISCLGLLGMATYAMETRIKEISIRKVLGSSSGALVLLLSKGFMRMLGISIILGVPLAYFVNNLWLEFIAYRTNMGIGVIAVSVFVLVLFGIVTIGSQTLRAALVRPVDNLKNE